MKGTTHLLFGLLLSAVFVRVFEMGQPLLAILLILLGSLLPDIDERHSLLGRKMPLIGFLFRHRTFFHSIVFGVVVSILCAVLLGEVYALAFAIGFVGHLLLDGLTPMGVTPFWPSKLKLKGFVRVGSIFEKIIFASLVLVFVYYLVFV